MSTTIEDESRRQISEFLPDAIAKSLTSYHRFADQSIPEDAKGFSAHHGACKVAIAHIELLIKLARWADLPDTASIDGNTQAVLAAMLEVAEKDVAAYRETSEQDEDSDT